MEQVVYTAQNISIAADVFIALMVLVLFWTIRQDRRSEQQTTSRIVETLDRISATQSQISETQRDQSRVQAQISETQKEQSKVQQALLTQIAVIDARGWGSNNPNG